MSFRPSSRTDPPQTMRASVRPVFTAISALVLFLLTAITFVPELSIGQRLTLFLFLGGSSYVLYASARERWTTLEVGERIHWRRPGLRLDLDRTAARAVRVARDTSPTAKPSTYYLDVEIRGRITSLPFEEHWLWGGPALRRAERLAQLLNVPLLDPTRDSVRNSFPILRWYFSGHEWTVVVLTLVLLLLIFGVGIALVS